MGVSCTIEAALAEVIEIWKGRSKPGYVAALGDGPGSPFFHSGQWRVSGPGERLNHSLPVVRAARNPQPFGVFFVILCSSEGLHLAERFN